MADPAREGGAGGPLALERLLALLGEGRLELQGRFLWGSNYTFLATVADLEGTVRVVYKPSAGERPLWDFDHETLARREVAAYRVSAHLGWPSVPPTALGNGPHGPGSVQLYINSDPEEHFFSLRETGRYDDDFRRIALFDLLINNADRKAGHCLLGNDERIWSIDHGLTFHVDRKLRTVIWDYAGEPLPAACLADLQALAPSLAPGRPLHEDLSGLLAADEIEALRQRLRRLARLARMPRPGPGRNVPYPLV